MSRIGSSLILPVSMFIISAKFKQEHSGFDAQNKKANWTLFLNGGGYVEVPHYLRASYV